MFPLIKKEKKAGGYGSLVATIAACLSLSGALTASLFISLSLSLSLPQYLLSLSLSLSRVPFLLPFADVRGRYRKLVGRFPPTRTLQGV